MLQLVLHCVIFSVICSNQLFHPYLNQIYEAPFKLIALVCLMSLATEYFIVWSKEKSKLKMYFHICCYRVVNNNLKSFWVSLKLPFYKQTGQSQQFKFVFLGTFFWVPIPVNWYEIHTGYNPGLFKAGTCKIAVDSQRLNYSYLFNLQAKILAMPSTLILWALSFKLSLQGLLWKVRQ